MPDGAAMKRGPAGCRHVTNGPAQGKARSRRPVIGTTGVNAAMTAGRQAGRRPRRAGRQQDPALRILDERLARGQIGVDEYTTRRAVLARDDLPPSLTRRPRRWAAIALAAVLAAGAGLAAAAVAGPGPWYEPWAASRTSCRAPSLPGTVVNVTVTDMMGRMMGGGMMRVLASPASVPAGSVSLRVANTGTLAHELVVLPLVPGQQPGSRTVGADGTVSEAGSLGEASATCAAGHGNGITPGAASWVTLTLRPGRYELICNLPGHYAMGMHTELDVS